MGFQAKLELKVDRRSSMSGMARSPVKTIQRTRKFSRPEMIQIESKSTTTFWKNYNEPQRDSLKSESDASEGCSSMDTDESKDIPYSALTRQKTDAEIKSELAAFYGC